MGPGLLWPLLAEIAFAAEKNATGITRISFPEAVGFCFAAGV